MWAKLARTPPEHKRNSLRRAWGRPMAATIAALLDLGWDRDHPTIWKDERGDEWDIGCFNPGM